MMDAKCKNVDNCTQTQLQPGIRVFYAIQKEVTSMQNSQAVKTGVALKSLDLKSCKIKGCSQEVTTKMLRFTRSWLLKLINLKIKASDHYSKYYTRENDCIILRVNDITKTSYIFCAITNYYLKF